MICDVRSFYAFGRVLSLVLLLSIYLLFPFVVVVPYRNEREWKKDIKSECE